MDEERIWAVMSADGKGAFTTTMPHFYMPSWMVKDGLTEQEATALEQIINSGETHGNR